MPCRSDMVSGAAQEGQFISRPPRLQGVTMNQVLRPQLQLLEAGNSEPVLPTTLLFEAKLPVDALVHLQQPVQTQMHYMSPLRSNQRLIGDPVVLLGDAISPSNAPDQPMRSDITNALK